MYAKRNPRSRDHAFPDPDEDSERFFIWIKLVGNSDLDDISHSVIRNTYIVCENHFESFFYKVGPKRLGPLSNLAVPTLNLTSKFNILFFI